ncbi:Bgt-20688, partial [Blumeria graminis f. sp. tritici]
GQMPQLQIQLDQTNACSCGSSLTIPEDACLITSKSTSQASYTWLFIQSSRLPSSTQ